MRSLVQILALGLLAMPASSQASPQSKWTLSGFAGVSAGDQTTASFSWRASVLHWRTPGAGIGMQVGRLRWEGEGRGTNVSRLEFPVPFEGLQKGGNELLDLSGSLRIRGMGGEGSAGVPFFALGAGAYWQNIRDSGLPAIVADPREGDAHIGWHVAFGGMGITGIAPGAEFRFDWVDTRPGPSTYFTASAALHLNR